VVVIKDLSMTQQRISPEDQERIVTDADATDDDFFDPEHFYLHSEPEFWPPNDEQRD
jgi:hypothetical protein